MEIRTVHLQQAGSWSHPSLCRKSTKYFREFFLSINLWFNESRFLSEPIETVWWNHLGTDGEEGSIWKTSSIFEWSLRNFFYLNLNGAPGLMIIICWYKFLVYTLILSSRRPHISGLYFHWLWYHPDDRSVECWIKCQIKFVCED